MDRSCYPAGTNYAYESGGYLSIEDAKFLAAFRLSTLTLIDTSIERKAPKAFKGHETLTELDLTHCYYVRDEDLVPFGDLP